MRNNTECPTHYCQGRQHLCVSNLRICYEMISTVSCLGEKKERLDATLQSTLQSREVVVLEISGSVGLVEEMCGKWAWLESSSRSVKYKWSTIMKLGLKWQLLLSACAFEHTESHTRHHSQNTFYSQNKPQTVQIIPSGRSIMLLSKLHIWMQMQKHTHAHTQNKSNTSALWLLRFIPRGSEETYSSCSNT